MTEKHGPNPLTELHIHGHMHANIRSKINKLSREHNGSTHSSQDESVNKIH